MAFHTSRGFPTPGLAADAVVVDEAREEVLLVQRGRDPGKGAWALPGGFVEEGETTEAACLRELEEETGVTGEVLALVGVYSDPGRDPRGHIVSVTYLCHARAGEARAGDDAADARWWPLAALPPLAFDHGVILEDAMAVLRRTG